MTLPTGQSAARQHPSGRLTHDRYEWLDEARGLVALLYVISTITAPLGGEVLNEKYQLGPTYLDHGYAYYKAYPAMITLIDTGQLIFLFLMGFAAYVAFSGRLRKRGRASAWAYAARRVVSLLALSFVGYGLLNMVKGTPVNWREVLYDGTLSRIALGAAAAYVATYFVRSADRRALMGIGAFVVHAFLFASYTVDRYPWIDDMLGRPKFPLGAFNLAGIAIVGSAFAQWVTREDCDLRVGFRRRIMPVSACMLLAAYCMEWVQPSEHHDVTTALALLSVGLSGLLVASTYALGEVGFTVPVLRPLGKNLILVFIVASQFVSRYVEAFPRTFLESYPYAGLFLVGALPIAGVALLTMVLEKRNIMIRL